jgi:DNA-binding MarR family transcriptional regulator
MARWGMMRNMSKNGSTGSRRKAVRASGVKTGQTLDLERYVPAFVTFIANKLSRSATAFYQSRFGVNVTEWRIMSLLAIEPGITASRICYVIGFDKGPVSRTLALMQKRGLIAIKTDPRDAYELAKRGVKKVAVLERGYIGAGGSGRNTTIIRANYRTPEGVAFYKEALRLYGQLAQELDYNLLFSQMGHLTLAHAERAVNVAHERAEVNRLLGVDSRVVFPE